MYSYFKLFIILPFLFFISVVHGMIAMDDVSDNNKIWRMLFAEFLGTAILLFLGCGSIMWLDGVGSSAILQISLTFGFTISTLVQVNPKIILKKRNKTKCSQIIINE